MQILDRAVPGEAKCFKEKVIFIRKIGVDEKTIKNDIRRRACSQKSGVSHTNFSMYFYDL